MALPIEPCSNTSGGACSGPETTTKVSPSQVGTVTKSTSSGHWDKSER